MENNNKESFTRQEVIDLLVHLQVANGNNKVFENTTGINFGEKAEKIVNTYIEIKDTNRSAISFGSLLG